MLYVDGREQARLGKHTQGGEGCVQTVRYKRIGTNRSREKIGRGRALHPSATGRALTVSIESSKIELHRRSTLWLPAVAPVKGTLCCSSVRISPHRAFLRTGVRGEVCYASVPPLTRYSQRTERRYPPPEDGKRERREREKENKRRGEERRW